MKIYEIKEAGQYPDCYSESLLRGAYGNKIRAAEDVHTMIEEAELTRLMYALQQAYICQRYWYYPWELGFSGYRYIGEEQYSLQPDDLERVTFYQDSMEKAIYFLPADTQWTETSNIKEQGELFVLDIQEIYPRRVIIPEPNVKQYCVRLVDATDIRDRLTELGTVEMEFPDEETIMLENRADNQLVENEYMQAVRDMIHGTLLENQRYGNYEIYIGEYFMTDDTGAYSAELGTTAVRISAAVVCVDDGYGCFFRFLASDILTDGKVEIYYHVSDTMNIWRKNVKQAMADNRLMLSLTVNPEDEVEIPENPYSFVMFPVLD